MRKLILLVAPLAFGATNAFAATEAVDELNDALQGEISAVETYRQALEKVGDEPEAATLRDFMKDHQSAADALRAHVTELGGTPEKSSGAWGTWAKTVTGTAKLFGDAAALRALKEGEEHGLKEHKELALDTDVPVDIRAQIRDSFVPKQEKHIKQLDEMIKKIS